MKIAASDFDNTLVPNTPDMKDRDLIPKKNVEGIKKWQAAGHKFGVVSGRCYEMMKTICDKNGIVLDYMVLNNGGSAFDNKGNTLFTICMPNDILHELWDDIAYKESPYILLQKERSSCSVVQDRPKVEEMGVPIIDEVSLDEAQKWNDVIQVCIACKDRETAIKYSQNINEKYGDYIEAIYNRVYIDIVAKGIDKANGITKFLENSPWEEPEAVLTIGDDMNDVPMLKSFKGFTPDWAFDEIKKYSQKSYPSVGAMLVDNI